MALVGLALALGLPLQVAADSGNALAEKVPLVKLPAAEAQPKVGLATQMQGQVQATLVNTYWKLLRFGDGSHVDVYDHQPEPHLVLQSLAATEPDKAQFHGAGGCNRLRGSYTLQGHWLRFGPVARTRQACAQGMRSEQEFINRLGRVTSFAVQGQRLLLSDADGQPLLRFEAVYLR